MTRWAGVALTDRRAERRALLIDAAYALFGTGGEAALTVRSVCRESALNTRYFYESFADIGELLGAVFDKVAADSSIPQAPRDMAKLRAGYILVDSGSYQDVSSRVEVLTNDTNPLRHSAREALGLSAWKEGKAKDALALFEQIATDETAPRNARDRASMLSDLIRGAGDAS